MLSPETVEQAPSGQISEFKPEFRILVSENPSHVAFGVGRFPWQWMEHQTGRQIDEKISRLFSSLQTGRYWDVISKLDGSNSYDLPDSEEKRQEARKWAKENFTHWELNNLLDLCVGVAISVPFEIGAPGSKRGHSILYRELVEKPDSMFGEAVTPEFKKRLNNGRFWEELADMSGYNHNYSYDTVEDVLINHFQDLDVEFALKGYNTFKRNDGENGTFHISELSDKAINRYIAFIQQIQDIAPRIGIQSEQMARLVGPYAEAIIGTKGEYELEEPRFPEDKGRSFIKRLHEPIVVEYLTHSKLVRSSVAHELYLMANYGNRNLEYVFKIISHIPNSGEMFDLMIASSHTPEHTLNDIIKDAFKAGVVDIPYGPISRHMLHTF